MSSFFNSNRRTFLRGAGGSLLAVPFLESFSHAKEASKKPPKRMVFLGTGFGFTKESFYPTQAGRFGEIGLTEGLSPLKRHQNDITMIANLTNLGATDPHGGSTSYLTGANVAGTPGKRFHNSISCDQVAAKHLGKDTRYPFLALSNDDPNKTSDGHGKGLSLSWNEAGKPIPALNNPLEIYTALFGQSSETAEQRIARLKKKNSLLDTMRIDAGSINKELSKNDQVKLDEYLQSMREIETALAREAEWSAVPKPKAPVNQPAKDTAGEEQLKLTYDLIIAALQTDSTRVITYKQPVNSVLKSVGISLAAHSLSHYGFSEERTKASKQRDQITCGLFAHFLDRLKAAQDMDGSSLFDNCIVSFGTNLRSGHDLRNLPAILSGGAAKNIKHGKHIMLPNEDTPLANLWLTLLQQADVPIESFSHSTGELSEILTS